MLFVHVNGGDAPQSASISRSVETTWFACSSSMARSDRCLMPPSAIGPLSPATSKGPSRRKSMHAQYPPIGRRRLPGGGALELVAQIERGVEVVRERLPEEAGVHAVEGLGVAVVGALHGGAALGQREAGHLHSAE